MVNTKKRMLFFGIFLFILLISATVYASLPYAECNQMGSASQTHVACNASGGANEDWTDATFDFCHDGASAGPSYAVENMFVWANPKWGSHRVCSRGLGWSRDDGIDSRFGGVIDCPARRPDGGFAGYVEYRYRIPNVGWWISGVWGCQSPGVAGQRIHGTVAIDNPEEGTYYTRAQVFRIEDMGPETNCLGPRNIFGVVNEETACCDSDYADRDDMSYYARDFRDCVFEE